jgi:hypothetical protein
VTAQAGELFTRTGSVLLNSLNDLLMTIAAGFFGYILTMRLDLNVVFVTTGGEIERMPETIACFRGVLADEVRRCVTAIACRDRAM